jgi:hypothetical protein
MRAVARENAREARRVWIPLLLLSIAAVAAYRLLSDLNMEELGRSAIYDVVMTFAVLGLTAVGGILGCLVAGRVRDKDMQESADEGYCFVGAVIGTVVFFVAMTI